jgi:hypothetical protein
VRSEGCSYREADGRDLGHEGCVSWVIWVLFLLDYKEGRTHTHTPNCRCSGPIDVWIRTPKEGNKLLLLSFIKHSAGPGSSCIHIVRLVKTRIGWNYFAVCWFFRLDGFTLHIHICCYSYKSAALFVVCLTTLFSYLGYVASNDRAISEWWIGSELKESGHGLILRYYPGICLKGLGKTTKSLSQDSRSSGLDLNPEPPEYDAVW